jgi:hypothetical protein
MTADKINDHLQADISAMAELVSQLPDSIQYKDPTGEKLKVDPAATVKATNEADFRTLEVLLTKLDPAQQWGHLSRTTTPEGLTLYLCKDHSELYKRAARS